MLEHEVLFCCVLAAMTATTAHAQSATRFGATPRRFPIGLKDYQQAVHH